MRKLAMTLPKTTIFIPGAALQLGNRKTSFSISKKGNNTSDGRCCLLSEYPSVHRILGRFWGETGLRPNRLGLGRGCKFDEESFLLVIEHLLQGGLDQILGREVNAQ